MFGYSGDQCGEKRTKMVRFWAFLDFVWILEARENLDNFGVSTANLHRTQRESTENVGGVYCIPREDSKENVGGRRRRRRIYSEPRVTIKRVQGSSTSDSTVNPERPKRMQGGRLRRVYSESRETSKRMQGAPTASLR